jgi:adenylosuccinate synthase
MDAGKRLLFEGANATLLDIDHGTYPFVTSSNCSSLGVHTGAGIPGQKVTNVLGIVKAYQTRVGGGPMPTELFDDTGDRIREVGKEYGTTTGRPRRVGWLDLMALRYTAEVSGATGIALMLMDVLAGMTELKLCTGYSYRGRELENFPADAAVLEALEPVYETVPGFEGPIDGCRRFDDLPPGARAYLQRIEQFVGVPVVLVSVGPRRDQTVLKNL